MEEVFEVFDEAVEIDVYREGVKTEYSAGTENFKEILDCWNKTLDGAHQMPAFGVSLNAETVKNIKSGVWAEFVFDKTYESYGLPFEKLLVNAGSDFYGFNLIRYTSQYGYDGRCIYIDLVGKNMNDFYDLLLNL